VALGVWLPAALCSILDAAITGDWAMEASALQEKVAQLESKREVLVQLLEQSDLGSLRVDINQALEELDELLEAFERTFPGQTPSN